MDIYHQNILSSEIKKYLIHMEENILSSSNKSNFYKYIKSKLSTHASLPHIRIYQNNVASNDLDKAKCSLSSLLCVH